MTVIISQLFTIIGFVLAILLIARLMREKRNPGSTIAWLLAIVFIPYLGIPFYLLFGGRKIKWMMRKKGRLYTSEIDNSLLTKEYKYNTELILVKSGAPPVVRGNHIELLPNGKTVYTRLIELLEGAQHSIDITIFILGHDEIGKSIVTILARKAQEGVNVRLILDSLGCLRSKGHFVEPLRKAGGKVGIFMPILPFHKKWSAHLRNHRKITIVDRYAAIMGGRNFASEYMMEHTSEKKAWYDFDVFLKGPIVHNIHQIFEADWDFATGGHYSKDKYFFAHPPHLQAEGDVEAQVVASGPDVSQDSLSEAIITAILEAKKRVWVITPYFIPDEIFLKSLALSSQWGREVRIIVPARSNHLLADLGRGSYLRTLDDAGVNILFFNAGMVHSKIILIDNSIAIVGSANMDMRSLHFNYEISLFIYSSAQVKAIEQTIKKDLLPFTYSMERGKHTLKTEMREWVEDISRVLSPFL